MSELPHRGVRSKHPISPLWFYSVSHRSESSHRGMRKILGPNDLIRFPHRDRSLGTPVRKKSQNEII